MQRTGGKGQEAQRQNCQRNAAERKDHTEATVGRERRGKEVNANKQNLKKFQRLVCERISELLYSGARIKRGKPKSNNALCIANTVAPLGATCCSG